MIKKLKSVKFWITLFCCSLLVYIVVANRVDFLSVADRLTLVPLIYLPVNMGQKYIFSKDVKEKDDNGK